MDKEILGKWLKAGYIEKGRLYPSHKGTPQGGIASPTIANMTLDGLEEEIRKAVPRRSRVNFVRYADDFIVTGKSKRLLEMHVKPKIEAFLQESGLSLSQEKTTITYIKEGFTFLGQTFCKHGRVLHITPCKEGVRNLIQKIGKIIRTHRNAPMEVMIVKLNRIMRGWGNYHRHIVASETFSRIDNYVYHQLWRMLHRRHPTKSKGWLINKYWSMPGHQWVFAILSKRKKGEQWYKLTRLREISIKRYIKIKADANPYLSEYGAYFWQRRHKKESWIFPALSAREFRAMMV